MTPIVIALSIANILLLISYKYNKKFIENLKKTTAISIKEKDSLNKELSIELQSCKQNLESVQEKLIVSTSYADTLKKDNTTLKEVLAERLEKQKQTYAYLDNFFNNGIFYDEINDVMVIIPNLVRICDYEEKEVKETQKVD